MSAQKHIIFQTIANLTLRQRLNLLTDQELFVSMITGYFPMSRTALRILLESKIESAVKMGREKLYKFLKEGLFILFRAILRLQDFDASTLTAPKSIY